MIAEACNILHNVRSDGRSKDRRERMSLPAGLSLGRGDGDGWTTRHLVELMVLILWDWRLKACQAIRVRS